MPDTKLTIYYTPLRDDVSRRFGKRLTTATDFINLSQAIQDSKAGYVSPSTLKRFWGYVSDSYSGRRQTTLDVLAVYLGYDSYSHYCSSIEKGEEEISGYNTSMSLDVGTLPPGSRLSVSWHPDRSIIMTYHGEFNFTIDEVKNSRLRKGCHVRAMTIIKGEPLILTILPDNADGLSLTYIAGKKNGVEWRLDAAVDS